MKNRTAPDFGISSGIYLERALILVEDLGKKRIKERRKLNEKKI